MIVKYVPPVASLADVLERLGNVPLNRICADPPPGRATEADLLRFADGEPKRLYELVDATLVEKTMGTWESHLGMRIGTELFRFVEAHNLGIVIGADGQVRLAPGSIRVPDVSFIPWSSLPGGQLPDEAIWTVTPALAVEVLSASNTAGEMDRKRRDLFAAGCRVLWVIDPVTQTAEVWTSVRRHRRLTVADRLTGGKILPGFTLPLPDLFATTRRPPTR